MENEKKELKGTIMLLCLFVLMLLVYVSLEMPKISEEIQKGDVLMNGNVLLFSIIVMVLLFCIVVSYFKIILINSGNSWMLE